MTRHASKKEKARADMASRILDWYDSNARSLPWRAPPGASRRSDPYHVWLSEIMLQQTTVAAVIPYYHAFLDRWPTVEALARTPLDDVLAAWAGLGYYARARNLHRCAGVVADELGGRFPDNSTALRQLPGIGPYTAGAIAAIAFDEPATVVDGNVERVMARVFAVSDPLPAAKTELARLAATLTPRARPGDYAQAVMDLGATVCTPRRPKCLICPWAVDCRGRAAGIAETLPRRARDKSKPVRTGTAYWVEAPHPDTGENSVLLVRRPPRGMLGGMLALPSEGWDGTGQAVVLPDLVESEPLDGAVRHTFTHFYLELTVRVATLPTAAAGAGEWWPLARLDRAGLPSLMKKAARLCLGRQ